jgi:hypothetical protein
MPAPASASWSTDKRVIENAPGRWSGGARFGYEAW